MLWGGVWASVTKRLRGGGWVTKTSKKSVTYFRANRSFSATGQNDLNYLANYIFN